MELVGWFLRLYKRMAFSTKDFLFLAFESWMRLWWCLKAVGRINAALKELRINATPLVVMKQDI